MYKCEVERIPISLAAVKLLGDAHLKCCIQMYFSLALITKGSVRTLIRSVEETNGAEAWRLIHGKYAPDTQNRQYASTQKIMMPAKPWGDHAEGFESGLRAWELDVGELERASGTALADAVKYTVMMNMSPIFLRNSLQLGTYANSAALRTALLQWCYSSRNFERIRPCHLENRTRADDRMQVSRKARRGVKANTKTRREIERPARPTRALQTSTRGRTVAELGIGRKTVGDQVDNSITQKGKSHKKGKGNSKHVDVVETNQASETASTVWYPSQTPQYNWRTLVQFKRGTVDHGCDNQFRCVQGGKFVQSICFLTVVHSFTHVRSRIQDKSTVA